MFTKRRGVFIKMTGPNKKKRVDVGVDPGKKGGLAFFEDGVLISFFPTPLIKGEYNLTYMSKLLRAATQVDFAEHRPPQLWIEDVHSYPHQGVKSMFTFGYGVGIWIGLAIANGYKINKVRPQVWKKHFNLIKKDKEASIKLVKKLYPTINLIPHGCRVASDGIAESILIGLFGVKNGV